MKLKHHESKWNFWDDIKFGLTVLGFILSFVAIVLLGVGVAAYIFEKHSRIGGQIFGFVYFCIAIVIGFSLISRNER